MPVKGKKFPDFNLSSCEDASRTKMSKIAGRGTPVVIVIYTAEALECKPALQAAEEFAMTHSTVRVILLNVEDSASTAQSFLGDEDITHCESFLGKIPAKYDIREGVYPFHIVIDASGTVVEASEDTVDLNALFD
eukprot:CAMPEP_0171486626 /NCGR_PEP_ID=MMETSP0958-20121227/1193_1 /TAXON_ID=87120 /ORGANISM="Aurantiochytrium limacinum, Strain ATCCMYA-1381" /LENGTH=134 /DNA_ID=CAMNT_0012019523 /DNA_START=164 /DNA_END=568 /DNA_ORIENTATION=-